MQQQEEDKNQLKLLYQFEHENRRLSLQIHTLTLRFKEIITKTEVAPQPFIQNSQILKQNQLMQQVRKLNNQVQKVNNQTQTYRSKIDVHQEEKCINLQNVLRSQQIQIMTLNKDLQLKKKHLKKQDPTTMQAEKSLKNVQEELSEVKKIVKQLQVDKNEIDRKLRKEHIHRYNQLAKNYSPQHNYSQVDIWRIQRQLDKIEKEKEIQKDQSKSKQHKFPIIPKRNQHYTAEKINKKQISDKKYMIDVIQNKIDRSVTIEAKKIKQKEFIPFKINRKAVIRNNKNEFSITPSLKINSMCEEQIQTFNDKNIKKKQNKKIQWNGSHNEGIGWDDQKIKSLILGANIWIDKQIIGLQFLFERGQSQQHLYLTKGMSSIQYRLSTNDTLSNVVLTIKQTRIIGLQFQSKNGRIDYFGIQKGKKFNFGGLKSQSIINTFGKYKIIQNMSQITSLGFQFA